MTNQLIISKPVTEVLAELEKTIDASKSLVPNRIDEKGFYLFSKKNYGAMSMIEKPYYNVKGRFEKQGDKTQIKYEVKGNATFRILSFVLPIMFLPTVFMGAAGGDKSYLMTGLIVYLLVSAITVFWALSCEKDLRKQGESDFKAVLKKLENEF